MLTVDNSGVVSCIVRYTKYKRITTQQGYNTMTNHSTDSISHQSISSLINGTEYCESYITKATQKQLIPFIGKQYNSVVMQNIHNTISVTMSPLLDKFNIDVVNIKQHTFSPFTNKLTIPIDCVRCNDVAHIDVSVILFH